MLTFVALVMLSVLPFLFLTVFAGISGLPLSEYEKAANDKAMSVIYETGQAPGNVTVIGREIAIRGDKLHMSPVYQGVWEDRQWRKGMIEQAIIDTCITMLTKCGEYNVDLLWAFMPNENGPVSEIVSGSTSVHLDCENATAMDYARYGRYLFKRAIPEEMLSITVESAVMNYHYSRPATGTGSGCSFYDMVDLR